MTEEEEDKKIARDYGESHEEIGATMDFVVWFQDKHPEKQFWNGKQFFQSWKCTDEIDAEVVAGDNLGIGVGLWNSYDGSISGRMTMFAYRLACTNGMTSKENFAEYVGKTYESAKEHGWQFGIGLDEQKV